MSILKEQSALDYLISQRDEKEYEKIKSRMLIATKIADTLKAKGLTQKDFAMMLGKKPSEISKWLTGNHNFTHDTLFDIQSILNIKLLDSENRTQTQTFTSKPIEIKLDPEKKTIPFSTSICYYTPKARFSSKEDNCQIYSYLN